jgi:hypothetical protein
MVQIVTCYVILNNMIVKDEYKAVERTDLSGSHLFSAHLSKV